MSRVGDWWSSLNKETRATLIAAIVAALIGLIGTVSAAYIMGPNNSSGPATPSAPPTSHVTPSVNSTTIGHVDTTDAPLPLERRVSYGAYFNDSMADFDVVWPNSGPVRLAGEFKLRGSLVQSPCSVSVTFEAKDSNDQLLTQDGRTCETEKTGRWPRYGTLSFGSSISGIDIAAINIAIFVDNKTIKRIICLRSGDCHVE